MEPILASNSNQGPKAYSLDGGGNGEGAKFDPCGNSWYNFVSVCSFNGYFRLEEICGTEAYLRLF